MMTEGIGPKPKAEMDWKRGTGFYDEMDMDAYLKRIHAYYKAVEEDAYRWRKLRREDPDATIDIYEEFDGAIEELNFLREQIEFIRKYAERQLEINAGMRPKRALEILKGEFERSDASLISRHSAAKTWIQRYKPARGSFNRLNQQPFIELEKILEGLEAEG